MQPSSPAPAVSLLALGFLAAFAVNLSASDWPQFRGPDGKGVAADSTIPETLAIQWSVPLPGRGLSSPIITGERLFLTAASGPKQDRLHLLCFNTSDGTLRWQRRLLATGRTMAHQKTSVAANTPCTDGARVFALWSSNDLAAFDLDGNLLWVRGLTSDYPNASNSLGMASSLTIIGNTLVTMIENDSESYSLGIDPDSGVNRWKLSRPKASNWTTPTAWQPEPGAPPAALLQSSKGIAAVDPVSGSILWEYGEGASTTSSSTVVGGIIYAPSHGITALQPAQGQPSPRQLWRTRQISPATVSPLVMAGRIFTINGAGILTSSSSETGEIQWKLRLTGPFSGSPVGDGARVLVASEKGLAQVIDATGAEGKLCSQLQLPLRDDAEHILSTPAIQSGAIYLRTDSTLWRLGAAAR